jgi:hypothetical protein
MVVNRGDTGRQTKESAIFCEQKAAKKLGYFGPVPLQRRWIISPECHLW